MLSLQDILDMMWAGIPSDDIEEIMVQGYDIERSKAQEMIRIVAPFLWKQRII